MEHIRPKSVTVLSVLNFVIGGIGIIWALAGLLTIASHSPFPHTESMMGMILLFNANNILSVVTFSLAIVSGIALFSAKSWARSIALAFIIVMLVNILLSAIILVLILNDEQSKDIGFAVAIIMIYLAYPITFLFFLNTNKWKSHFSIRVPKVT